MYAREHCIRTFAMDLDLHLQCGYVFSTPEVFVMGRPVRKGAEYVQLTDPAFIFDRVDCWWVYLAAGDLGQMMRFLPYELPWFGWERDNKPRYWRAERIKQWLKA